MRADVSVISHGASRAFGEAHEAQKTPGLLHKRFREGLIRYRDRRRMPVRPGTRLFELCGQLEQFAV